jgi:hypothetical protein
LTKRKKNELGNKMPSSIENGSSENTSVVGETQTFQSS